jgi:hypothetical protein
MFRLISQHDAHLRSVAERNGFIISDQLWETFKWQTEEAQETFG